MAFPTLYLCKEQSRDPVLFAHGAEQKPEVVAYYDKECTKQAARWLWWYSNKPDRRNKWVTLDCCTWAATWLAHKGVKHVCHR